MVEVFLCYVVVGGEFLDEDFWWVFVEFFVGYVC